MSIGIASFFYGAMAFTLMYVAVPKGGRSWYEQFLSTYSSESAKVWSGFIAADLAWDLCLLFIPLPGFWLLNLSRSRKFAVAAIWTVGLLGTAVAAATLVAPIRMISQPDDATYAAVPVLICT